MILKDWGLNKKDGIYISLVLLISCLIMYSMVKYYLSGGMYDPDKAIYLIDALKFAGLDYYNICLPGDIFYSPIICFLTSILFRLGLVNELAIFIVTGLFGLLCNIGLYVLFRYKFSHLLSFTGFLIFICSSVVIWNIASGGIDIPSIAVSIWVIIFTIVAVEKNHKYFILVFPLFVIGFFTKYPAGFILPVIFVYYCHSKDILQVLNFSFIDKNIFKQKIINYIKSDEFKYIFISVCLGLFLIVIISLFILNNGGSLTFIEQSSNTIDGSKFNLLGPDANNSRLYYLKTLPTILFEENRIFGSAWSYLLLGILGLGFLLKFKSNFKNLKVNKFNFNKNFNIILTVVGLISILNIFLGFVVFRNNMLSNISIVILNILIYYLIKTNDSDELKFVLINLTWFSLYFVFFSLYNTKVPRYFLPILPPLIFFILFAFEEILSKFDNIFGNLKEKKQTPSLIEKPSNIILIIFVLLLLCTTLIYVIPLAEVNEGHHTALVDVTDYIVSHDSEYHTKEIVSYDHYFMIIKWYININGTKLRYFETDLIDDLDYDYAIINHGYNFKNYHEIYKKDDIHLFAHN